MTTADLSSALRWRSVGPSRGGRSVAVAGHPDQPAVAYFGACAGGVWRTDDGGTYWRNVSDGWLTSSAIGAIALAPSRPSTVWVGTGEACVRNNVVQGDGVYRSLDDGATWQHRGLAETRHISRVRVHPGRPETVVVAALGDIFSAGGERGVYRTDDDGETWERILHVDEHTGAADLSLDPNDPDVMFAAMWQAIRHPWDMRSGGPGSDLFRTLDGGRTWEPMSASPGFPTGLLGRIGVSVSPARPERVYAVVEAEGEQSGLYRSDDRGGSWTRVNAESGQTGRPWYYSHVFADPVDADTVYTCNLSFWRSRDGGETFTQVQTPHGDNHDLWIDPRDPQRLVQGNDGGACISYNGGQTFSSIYNQSTAQIYRVDIGREFPFDLYGTQQDNSGIRVPSRSWKGAIRWPDCLELGEAEAGDVACDPADPRFVVVGGAGFGHPGPLLRFDQVTEQPQDIAVWVEHFMGTAPSTHRHRFGWTYPIEFSQHDPGLLYVAGERVFRSADKGMSWEAISPDLTRDDPSKQTASGGPITPDTTGAEVYCTIYAFAESPLDPAELWAGSDDGLVHVTRDGGETWHDVTPPELPPFTTVTRIEVSRHASGTAYVAAHGYRIGDRAPYLWRTEDHGRSWESLAAGLPAGEWLRSVREDPARAGLLYVGTERAARYSADGGRTWAPLGSALPPVPVYDLKVRDHELVAATHGRGFWVLDDLTPVREAAVEDSLVLHTPPLVYRYPTPTGFDMPGEGTWVGGFPGVPLGGASFTVERDEDGTTRNVVIDGGENPPNGLAVWYRAGADLADQPVTLRITDSAGAVLRTLSSEPVEGRPAPTPAVRPARTGLQRLVWDLRVEPAVSAPGEDGSVEAVTPGPRVPPGSYGVELVVGDQRRRARVRVVRDPRIFSDDAALQAQYELLVRVRDRLDDIGVAVSRIRSARAAGDGLPPEVDGELERLEKLLLGSATNHADELKRPPGLVAKLKLLPEIVVELSDTAPTAATRAVLDQLDGAVRELELELDAALAGVAVPSA
ncbi:MULTISPECIES: sialidase family protein [unclassified Blastococcus]|uniref:sialidase family protein n=1 Tax=unclassified Blastococcus TaxID=2619396 RepID=UPI001EEFA4C9|nr:MULTISPECIES: sialidase family protein [unclassified Blastococcus]